MRVNKLSVAVLALMAAAASATAQTRTAEIEASRERKAQALQKENVTGLENAMLQFKQRKLMERLTSGYNGLRAQFGSLATGSGFSFGPDFLRDDFLNGQLQFNVAAALSTKIWQKYHASVTLPHLAGNHLLLRIEATRRDYRALEFYGIGPESSRDDRTAYRMEDTDADVSIAIRPARFILFGGSVGGLWPEIRPGKHTVLPSTETVFNDASAPGIDRQANFLRTSIFGQIDYRDDPAGPKSGGNYVSAFTWFEDRSLGAFSFNRWDIDAQQYIPFLNKSRRFALKVRMTMTDARSGQRVPFYMQPFIGGSDDLRGFKPYRFSGPNAVVYNAEYRWEIFSGLDGALFFDAGKVMAHRGHLGMSNLETSSGFGLRFNAKNRTFIRLDVGFSHEGTCIWVKFNDPFLPVLFSTGNRQPLY